jgi:hypothetical protein
MTKHFPKVHRVIAYHSWSGEPTDNPVVRYIQAVEFDDWCDWAKEKGYDVCDDGTYERLMHTPHTTEVWCYPQWVLRKQEE